MEGRVTCLEKTGKQKEVELSMPELSKVIRQTYRRYQKADRDFHITLALNRSHRRCR